MRIKYIIPFPFDDVGVANRAAQVPQEILGPDTEVECVPVRNAGALLDSAYDALVFDMYVAEAGPPSGGRGLRRGGHRHDVGLGPLGAAVAPVDPRASGRASSPTASGSCSASASRS